MLNDTTNFANWASSPPSNQWIPISTSALPFTGTFDGNGHTISGLYISDSLSDNKALFMYTENCTIKDLILTNCHVNAKNFAAGITSSDRTEAAAGINIMNC